jgi:chondroitin 4-sulfotransferase 11
MPVFNKLGCIFVHIPKCGGQSVSATLRKLDGSPELISYCKDDDFLANFKIKNRWLNHCKAMELKLIVGESKFNHLFKFSFVRNPWDQMVSYYHYQLNEFKTSEQFRNDWPRISEIFHSSSSFKEWLKNGIYVEPQSEFLIDKDNQLIVDFVGKFENIKSDFKIVCKNLGVNLELLHLNQTTHEKYRNYYDDETYNLILNHFKVDIELFNYSI